MTVETGFRETDVAIIGSGPGGYVAAIRASQLGAKVTLVEKNKLGGVCTNLGCIPTKALLRSAELVEMLKEAPKHGVSVEKFTVNFGAAMARANSIASMLSQHVNLLMNKHRVEVIYGSASLKDERSLIVESREGTTIRVSAKKIIVASGSSPYRIPIPGSEGEGVLVSDDLFNLTSLPRRVVIVGAGAVGLEWAAIFRSFGSEVTVLEMMPQILPSEDEEIARNMARILEKQEIRIHTDAKASRIIDAPEGGKVLTFDTREGEKRAEGDLILLATGRRPNSADLGLENAGVAHDRGWISVDEHMQTNIPSIYAVGDVVGRFMLAHVAMQEGLVAAENAMGLNTKIDYKSVPRCVYTHPEVASIGFSENEAKKEMSDAESATYLLRANGRAITLNRIDGLVKLVYEKRYGSILGAQIISPEASEMIHEMGLAMRLEATAEDIASLIHAHPTLSETLREVALRAVGRPLHG